MHHDNPLLPALQKVAVNGPVYRFPVYEARYLQHDVVCLPLGFLDMVDDSVVLFFHVSIFFQAVHGLSVEQQAVYQVVGVLSFFYTRRQQFVTQPAPFLRCLFQPGQQIYLCLQFVSEEVCKAFVVSKLIFTVIRTDKYLPFVCTLVGAYFGWLNAGISPFFARQLGINIWAMKTVFFAILKYCLNPVPNTLRFIEWAVGTVLGEVGVRVINEMPVSSGIVVQSLLRTRSRHTLHQVRRRSRLVGGLKRALAVPSILRVMLRPKWVVHGQREFLFPVGLVRCLGIG